jgi:asparagine synthase (glutamine-hydrolysing)
MNTSIILKNNTPYSWHSNEINTLYVKGYAFDQNNTLREGQWLLEHVRVQLLDLDLQDVVKGLNGQFSILYVNENVHELAVDPIRTFPLYYTNSKQHCVISDSASEIIEELKLGKINIHELEDFKSSGYASGNQTLLDGLNQVMAGQLIRINQGIVSKTWYHHYLTTSEFARSAVELKTTCFEILENVIDRLISSANGRQLALALSGGYDSRFIVAGLKKKGYANVICFTYGREENNNEWIISQKVASTLNYPWYFIKYTHELINNYINTPQFNTYAWENSGYIAQFMLHEYFAVKYLKENKLINDDAIFVTGHSGDFLGGSQITKYGIPQSMSLKKVASLIHQDKFFFLPTSRTRKTIRTRTIESQVKDLAQVVSNPLPYSVYETWDMKEKLSKWIANSSRVFHFFGFESRLPFWDTELVDFFRQVPYKLKLEKKLYNEVMREFYFVPLNVSYESDRCLTLSVARKQQRKEKTLFKYCCKCG